MTATVSSQFGFSVNSDNRELRLDHPQIAATWSWDTDGHITLSTLNHLDSGTDWIDADFPSQLYSPPYRMVKHVPQGVPFILGPAHADLEPPTAAVENDGHAHAIWRMSPVNEPIELTWHIQAFPNHAVIRQWAEIRNTGDAPLTLDEVPILRFVFGGAPAELTADYGLERIRYRDGRGRADWHTWNTQTLRAGNRIKIHSGYTRNATWLGLTSADGGPGIFAGWESNAEAFCDVGDLHGDGALGLTCALRPNYRLDPGQTLTGPAGFIGLVEGDLDELSFRCQRFVDDHLSWIDTDERFPYVTFNSWGYDDEIDDASMRECFDICAKLGVELFVVDFGWEDPEWRPLADTFPNGLGPLADAAHAAGMKFGIHFSWGNISNLSEALKTHPEWGNGLGQWAYLKEGTVYGLTLANPAARDWLVERMIRVVDENKIDYFLTDHHLWGWTNPAAQEMHATDDYMTIADGFDDVLARFHAARPDVLIEHCDNGMSFATFKMVQQHMTSIGSDAAGTHYERVHTYRISRVLPPRYLDHYATDTFLTNNGLGLTEYEYRSQMFGGPMILMTPIRTLIEGSPDWNSLVRSIDLCKRIRKNILTGKVLHLIEPLPQEQLGHAWDGWDAIGSYHPESDSAVIFAFRLGGEIDTKTIPLHGLNPDTTYRVTFEDQPTLSYTRTGKDLIATGLDLTLPQPGLQPFHDPAGLLRASEVIFLNPE